MRKQNNDMSAIAIRLEVLSEQLGRLIPVAGLLNVRLAVVERAVQTLENGIARLAQGIAALPQPAPPSTPTRVSAAPPENAASELRAVPGGSTPLRKQGRWSASRATPEDRLMTLDEVAATMRISVRQVRKLIKAGVIAPVARASLGKRLTRRNTSVRTSVVQRAIRNREGD